ncbi:MAG TPA: tripartite tricarboxylate transporter TctB family protein [Candidatus Desulfovibrio intestinigallinarum]|nr:tripartite tricarboxylate transporter TctB family protein [Candidatus Desulfovibrio intestinigallinarum]
MKFFDPGRFLIGAIFLAFGLVMLHQAVTFECSFTPEPFSLHPMDFPKGVLVLWCLLSVLYILVPREPVVFISLKHVAPRLIKTALAILFFILALRHAGFVLAGILMLLMIFHVLDFRSLRKSVPIAVFSIVLVWAVFVHLLQIPLPQFSLH